MPRLDSVPPVYLDTGLRLDSSPAPVRPERRKMAQLALGLARKDKDQKIILADTMAKAFTENATTFPDPDPTPVAITAAGTALRTAITQLAEAEAVVEGKRAIVETKEDELDALLTKAGKYSENVTNGDPAKLALTGAPLKGTSAPIGELPAPGNLRVSIGDKPGENDLIWDAVKGAMVYLVRYGTTLNGPWTQGYMGTMSKCTIANLTSGQEYIFQSCAVGAAGQGAWSDIASKRAA